MRREQDIDLFWELCDYIREQYEYESELYFELNSDRESYFRIFIPIETKYYSENEAEITVIINAKDLMRVFKESGFKTVKHITDDAIRKSLLHYRGEFGDE